MNMALIFANLFPLNLSQHKEEHIGKKFELEK